MGRLRAALALWTTFVLAFAALSYADRASGGKPPKDVLYKWSTLAAYLTQYVVIGLIVWGIAGLGSRWELFALRRPTSWSLASKIGVGVVVGMIVLTAILTPILEPGREQGLTPTRWEPAHAGAYIANGIAIAVFAPLIEELTFRGLGFSLLRRYGEWTAIVVTALAFGLAHGLVEALPLLVAFGLGLGYLRSRVDSIYPGIVVHGTFNAAALIFAVAH
jgi:membrane protease YdiL (CAAX protease family)